MMIATFKEFKQKIIRNIFQNQKQLQFASRRLTWAGHEYLLCRAVIPDIAEMLEIQRQVYGGQVPWNEEVFRKELSQKKAHLYLVVRYHDELVAFAGIDLERNPKQAHITNIAVLPQYQGRKIGTMLMELLLTQAQDAGCHLVSLEVATKNQVAQQLYRTLGFRVVKVQINYYLPEGEDAYLMEKELRRRGTN